MTLKQAASICVQWRGTHWGTGHTGSHALPIGGCALPLEVCLAIIKLLPRVTSYLEISIEPVEFVADG